MMRILLGWWMGLSLVPHPLHVSTSDITFNASEQKLQVVCTIFTDDFEAALSREYRTKADLSNKAQHAAMDVMVKKYIASTLQVKTNTKISPLNYLGFEQEKEVINIYLESAKLPVFRKIDVDNVILYEQYADQMSIVHITVNGQRKSHRLDYPEHVISETF